MTSASSSLPSWPACVSSRQVQSRTGARAVPTGDASMNGKVTYRQHVSFCGKPKCRKCRDGIGHGPYWYAYQVIDGHTVRRYIGKHLPAEAKMSENPLVELDSLQQVDLHIAHGALPEAIDILDRLLAIDPANEKA